MFGSSDKNLKEKLSTQESNNNQFSRQVSALYGILCDMYGTDKLVLKASKMEALGLLRSAELSERVLALERVIYEDPTIDKRPADGEIPHILARMQDEIADQIARRSVEDNLERKIQERMEEKHDEYVQEIKMQIIKENNHENAQTLKRLAALEKLDQTQLARTAMDILRPRSLKEIEGQERAVEALVSKLVSPYPQHIILYGPPGVGKTTAARLALDEARKLKTGSFGPEAPFIEVNGATLRWDPREVTNPLLGSVHDPIYQGARHDLAETGIPEPKLGLVTDAHGGVLFIDEIGEMDPLLLNKLLKVLEDKRVFFDSAYYDPHDDAVPRYIKKIFEEGVPADFVLIGATTREPCEINPAIRSRCAEVYFEPLTPGVIQEIIVKSASKLGVELEPGVPEIISEYTMEGRKANNILADSYGLALYKEKKLNKRNRGKPLLLTKQQVYKVIRNSRMEPYTLQKAGRTPEVGRIFGLGVSGFVGTVLEIEAVAFKAYEKGKGSMRFNDAAGKMAKDSVFNAASVFRKLTGSNLNDYDIHVNVTGGGNIDGPSAGTAIFLAIASAVQERPLKQDVAVTGELSIQGKILPVGGIFEKIFGAKQAGVREVIIPQSNKGDVPEGIKGIKVNLVKNIEEAVKIAFEDTKDLVG